MISLVPALLLVSSSWAFVHVGETQGDFKPSAWSAPIPAAAPAAPVQAQGRSYGAARLKHSGYGLQKGGHHKVELGIDPGKIVLKCKVQEPLEHIVWIRQKCPNDHYDGGHLVAEGATVQDKTLYDVRILGGNSSITSELQLKKPLDPSTAGFYRCEAWPHGGGGGPSYGQNTAQDVYVIGGQEMLKRCFGGWDEGGQGHYAHDTWGKHRSTEQVAAPSASMPQHPAPSSTHQAAPSSHYQSSQQQYQYNHPQQGYVPRYNYSDLRHSSSHEAPSVAGRFRKEQQPEATTTTPSAGIITRTGPYQPQQHYQQQQQLHHQQQQQQQQQLHHQQQQQQAKTTTEAPGTQPPPSPPVKNFSPAALPPRSYIAATPQPLTAPFVPSLPFSQQMMRLQQQQLQEVTTQAPKVVNSTQASSDWDIEDLMKGYPYREQIRKGKAVKEEVVIVTPEPSV